MAEWEQCIAKEPSFAMAWRNLGWAHWLHTKNYGEAVKYYRKAIDLAPEEALFLEEIDQVYEAKGEDVQVLDLTELSDVCDYFVLATGTNNRQVDSIVDEIEEKVAEACGEHPFSIEGREQKTWMLMDYGSVVVHVFTPEARDFYRLEKLWGDAPQLPLNLL